MPIYKKYWNVDDEFVGHYRRFDPKQLENDLNEGFKILDKKPIGSFIERKLTLIIVKRFIKNQGRGKVKNR